MEATEAFEEARQSVAQFVGAAENEIVWVSNATEAINALSYAFSNATLWAARKRGGAELDPFILGPGDEIVVTEMEHHANLIPWQELAFRTGAHLRHIPVSDTGTIRMDEAQALIGSRARLVAFTHASNVLGTINPVDQLVSMAREVGP